MGRQNGTCKMQNWGLGGGGWDGGNQCPIMFHFVPRCYTRSDNEDLVRVFTCQRAERGESLPQVRLMFGYYTGKRS